MQWGGSKRGELAGLGRGFLGLLPVEVRATRGPFSVVSGRGPGGATKCQTVHKTIAISISYHILIQYTSDSKALVSPGPFYHPNTAGPLHKELGSEWPLYSGHDG